MEITFSAGFLAPALCMASMADWIGFIVARVAKTPAFTGSDVFQIVWLTRSSAAMAYCRTAVTKTVRE